MSDPVRQLVDAIAAATRDRPEVHDVYLFGSRARGDSGAHSDIDVAVYAEPIPITTYGYAAELATDLMTALGTSAVDVVLLNHAPPLLYHRVLRDGIRAFARDLVATTTREGRALSRYCDYVPQLAKIERAAKARAARGDFGR